MTDYCCYECGTRYREKQSFCPGCLEFNTMLPVPVEGKVFWQKRNRRLITATELANIGFKGKLVSGFEFLGRLPEEWLILLWGLPGMGKSTAAMRMASALCCKVLYCSSEQGQSESIAKILIDWEIRTNQIVISDAREVRELRQDLEEYKPEVLVIDSINVLGSTLNYPRAIWIAQATKDGNYRGEMAVSHEVDIVCCVIGHGEMMVSKNRLGGVVGKFNF